MDRIMESVRWALAFEAAERVSELMVGNSSVPAYQLGLGGATHVVTHGLLALTPLSIFRYEIFGRIITTYDLLRSVVMAIIYTINTILAIIGNVLTTDWIGPVAGTVLLLDNLIELITRLIAWPISLITGRSESASFILR